MENIFQFFPFILVAVILVNALIFRVRAGKLAGDDRAAIAEYTLIIRAFLIYGCGFFFLQGVGCALQVLKVFGMPPGELPGITRYDIFLYLVILGVNIRLLWWTYVGDGASVLARRGGIFNSFPKSPTGVKLLIAFVVASGVVANSWVVVKGFRTGVQLIGLYTASPTRNSR